MVLISLDSLDEDHLFSWTHKEVHATAVKSIVDTWQLEDTAQQVRFATQVQLISLPNMGSLDGPTLWLLTLRLTISDYVTWESGRYWIVNARHQYELLVPTTCTGTNLMCPGCSLGIRHPQVEGIWSLLCSRCQVLCQGRVKYFSRSWAACCWLNRLMSQLRKAVQPLCH